VLAARVGLGAVATVLADAGARGCRMERLIGDQAATAAGLTNEVTPLGLARLLHAVVAGALTSAASREVMLEALRAQEFRVIAAEVATGVDVGSKSGWVEGIDHDAAFVGVPGAAGCDGFVVLAVCTAGFPRRTGRREIRRVAASVLPREFRA
jgi:beta-lactamase class A